MSIDGLINPFYFLNIWKRWCERKAEIMKTEKRDFDKEAVSWDENPARIKLAKDIAHAISRQMMLMPDMDVMDFGCGTGLLTIQLQPLVRTVTGVDSSQGMLDIFQMKVAKLNLHNVVASLINIDPGWPLENPPPVAGSKSPTPGSAERIFI